MPLRQCIGPLQAFTTRGGSTCPQIVDHFDDFVFVAPRGGIEDCLCLTGIGDDRDSVVIAQLLSKKAETLLQ